MFKRIILAVAILAAASAAHAADTNGFGLSVLVNDDARQEYPRGRTVYIEAVRGAEYSLRLTNPMPYRVAVALSVDGLNTIDARHTAARSGAKWVLEPYETTVISGWQVSDRAARRFFFTGEKHSYGALLGQTDNLGVIEAVFFREVQPVATWSPREDQSNAGASKDAPSAPRAQNAAAEGKLSDENAATGMGDRTRHEVQRVDIALEDRPAASIRIRYEFHPQLVKLGILPEHRSSLDRRERARGFSGYCPEPGTKY